MFINAILHCFLFVVLGTHATSAESDVHQQDSSSSNQLYHILGSLQPFRSQICQFKFENCIQDSSYADQLDNDCNIYSRLRDCFRSLLDETQCLTVQLKRQYKKAKQNEYESCGIALSFESIHASTDPSTSASSSLSNIDHLHRSILILLISIRLVSPWRTSASIAVIRWYSRSLVESASDVRSSHCCINWMSNTSRLWTRSILLNDICLVLYDQDK